MRRSLLTLSAVFALAVLANPVDAQFKFGAQAATMTSVDPVSSSVDLGGTFGVGGRIIVAPPLFPIALVVSGVNYFPDCTDCSYRTASAALQLRMPTPIVAPYALVGYQTRRTSAGGASTTDNGAMIGAGVQFNFMMSLFLEATLEFTGEDPTLPTRDTSPIVIKGGIMFG